MGNTFDRCIYCFAPKDEPGPCSRCGYENGLCDPPSWWLSPGTILKDRYMVGWNLKATPEELCYLGWDLGTDTQVEIVEFYPEAMVTRDITHCEAVSCLPGRENAFETGKQNFFEKAKLYYNCVSRVNTVVMDFFVRNHTCYYVRKRPYPHPNQLWKLQFRIMWYCSYQSFVMILSLYRRITGMSNMPKPPARCIRAGGIRSIGNVFDRSKKSERIPGREQVRIFHVWWTI